MPVYDFTEIVDETIVLNIVLYLALTELKR